MERAVGADLVMEGGMRQRVWGVGVGRVYPTLMLTGILPVARAFFSH